MRSTSLQSQKPKKKIPKELLDSFKNTQRLPLHRPDPRYHPIPRNQIPYVVVSPPPQEQRLPPPPPEYVAGPAIHSRTLIDDILEDDIEKIAYQDCLEAEQAPRNNYLVKSIVTPEDPMENVKVERSASLPVNSQPKTEKPVAEHNKVPQQQPVRRNEETRSPHKSKKMTMRVQEENYIYDEDRYPQVYPRNVHIRKPMVPLGPRDVHMYEKNRSYGDQYYTAKKLTAQYLASKREQQYRSPESYGYGDENLRVEDLYDYPQSGLCKKHLSNKHNLEDDMYYRQAQRGPRNAGGWDQPRIYEQRVPHNVYEKYPKRSGYPDDHLTLRGDPFYMSVNSHHHSSSLYAKDHFAHPMRQKSELLNRYTGGVGGYPEAYYGLGGSGSHSYFHKRNPIRDTLQSKDAFPPARSHGYRLY